MSLISRLRERLKQEGVLKTCRYTGYAAYDTLRCLVRDAAVDWQYGGKLLNNRKTRFSHLGSNDVYHSDYDALSLIFDYCLPIKENDVLVDVGCGQGRVINYWLSKGCRNQIIGLELDPEIARQTAKKFMNWPNITIIAGDAINNLPPEGTLFYFYNPFTEDKVREFERRVRSLTQNKAASIVYYNPKSIDVFRYSGWKVEEYNFERDLGVKRWGRINKFHDLAVISNSA